MQSGCSGIGKTEKTQKGHPLTTQPVCSEHSCWEHSLMDLTLTLRSQWLCMLYVQVSCVCTCTRGAEDRCWAFLHYSPHFLRQGLSLYQELIDSVWLAGLQHPGMTCLCPLWSPLPCPTWLQAHVTMLGFYMGDRKSAPYAAQQVLYIPGHKKINK